MDVKISDMEKIKIFWECFDDDDDAKDFQKEINKWLQKHPDFKIKNISTAFQDEYYILTIHYVVGDNMLP